uniref:alpha-1,2-Mannosidase n=2 Tax=Macrostomum lignano TaxID=282301 RepID=A0A1I8IBQ7_9PLAT
DPTSASPPPELPKPPRPPALPDAPGVAGPAAGVAASRRSPLPAGSLGRLSETSPSRRQLAVLEAMRHSWKAYELYAWGKDEVHPLSKSSAVWMGAGLTLIDSLDTLMIMGMSQQVAKAREWVATQLNFDVDKPHTNVFETTIRLLGGLLSAHHLSNDSIYLDRALQLGERLLPAFSSPSGLPYSDINLHTGQASNPVWTVESSTDARCLTTKPAHPTCRTQVSSVQLELRELSRLTGRPEFADAADRISRVLHSADKKDGLVPIYVNSVTGRLHNGGTVSLGARGDSYYEYLIKQFVQAGKSRSFEYLRDDWLAAMDGVAKHLVRESQPHRFKFVGELLGGTTFSPKMDHLVCFLPGALAYGFLHGMPREHLRLAEQLMRTCYITYTTTATGLAPEITHFNTDAASVADTYVKPLDRHNIQRPETVESLFYMWRVTGDRKYQDWGWAIFQAFEKYTKVQPAGYVSISDVTNARNPGKRTKCESFWFAETLKYFFLLFSEDNDLLPLDKWLFNTEAHPLPIWPRQP